MNNNTNKENQVLEFDDKSKGYLNAIMVMGLFKILHNKNKISKAELDSLISNVIRRFNLNKEKD